MYYIYILYAATADLYYIGYTNDYNRRFLDHNEQEHFNTFTSRHRPWALKAVYEVGSTEGLAMRIEKFIKKQKSRKLIEKMVKGEKLTGLLAQLVRVPYVRD